MADPNPIGSGAGTLAPDPGKLQSELTDIESQFEPRIEREEQQAQTFETQAIGAAEEGSRESQAASEELSAADQEMQHWVDHTPTRQAAYTTAMHAAPLLSILTALGGRLTRLNGMQMLAATNGIVQGLNESSEQKYQDSINAWNSAYEKMRDHQRRLTDAHKLMLDSYRGRADAYQMAAAEARRMTGDLQSDEQRKKLAAIDSFKAQATAVDKAARIKFSYDQLHQRALKDIRQAEHWKALEKQSASMPAEIKTQLAAAHSEWQNSKSQLDELLKLRGQTANPLNGLSDEERERRLMGLDDDKRALEQRMDSAAARAQAIADGFSASRGGATPGAAAPGAPPPATAGGRPMATPVTGRPHAAPGGEQPTPGQLAEIKKHPPGSRVDFKDGSSWIQETDGTVRRVQ